MVAKEVIKEAIKEVMKEVPRRAIRGDGRCPQMDGVGKHPQGIEVGRDPRGGGWKGCSPVPSIEMIPNSIKYHYHPISSSFSIGKHRGAHRGTGRRGPVGEGELDGRQGRADGLAQLSERRLDQVPVSRELRECRPVD